MAQSYQTTSGTLIIPGAYAETKVQQQNSALATSGVLFLVGEASKGPHWSEEADIEDVFFGPDQESEVRAKFGSGRLVDAYRGAVNASADPEITGGPNRIALIKTNQGTQASSLISGYGTLKSLNYGKSSNLITRTITEAVAESLPSTGAFVLAPPHVSTVAAFRVNGGAEVSTTISASTLPSAMVSAIDGLTGVAATGGTNRSLVTAVAGNLQMVVDSGYQCHITISTAWANIPSVGDVIYIPTGSPLAAANEGTYVCTAATATRLDLYKVLDAAGTGAERTAPTNEGPTAIVATTNIQAFAPVVITTEAGAAVAGLGKSLEIANSGSNDLSDIAWVYSAASSPVATPATWVSTASAPYALAAVAEQRININVAEASTATSENLLCGGTVVLALGYEGTTASATIAGGVMTITVSGGAGTSPAPITLADYPTVADLVTYLNSLTGFSASAGTAAQLQKASADLDPGTYSMGSTHGARTGRIKADGKSVADLVAGSSLVSITPVGTQLVGLPGAATVAYLSGATTGASSNQSFQDALNKVAALRGNFVVSLVSQDASKDIAAGLTESGSTYDVASVNAQVRAHVLAQSVLKRKRHRLGIVSIKSDFSTAKEMAGNMASERVAVAFQDVKDLDASGTLKTFQPWMLAVKSAAAQAAGFYRGITNKLVQISGIVHQDFDPDNDTDVEDALLAGLLTARPGDSGGFIWVSDQTSYGKDNNQLLNSLQSMYAIDLVTLTSAQRMQTAVVGQSTADISTAVAKTVFETILDDMTRLKLLTPDSEAPRGYKDVKVKRNGAALPCSALLKITGTIYFVPISFVATTVQD